MEKYKAQFETSPDGNTLWIPIEDYHLVAIIEIKEPCSEDYGYLNLKETLQIYLETHKPEIADEIQYPYDGQEHHLSPDAYLFGVTVDIYEHYR